MNPFGASNRDPLSPLVADVVREVLRTSDAVTPIGVLLQLEILTPEQIEAWKNGAIPYLERGITAGLARVARILRLLREHALELGLEPVTSKYQRRKNGKRIPLRFSKRGDAASEKLYSQHFVRRS